MCDSEEGECLFVCLGLLLFCFAESGLFVCVYLCVCICVCVCVCMCVLFAFANFELFGCSPICLDLSI